MALSARHPGSFRDPAGRVFDAEGKIFRTVTEQAATDYEFLRDRGLFSELAAAGKLIPIVQVDRRAADLDIGECSYLLQHPKLGFISYPYEWPFAALKTAALFHLQLQLELLHREVMLSDASAYNIQFIGPKPLFIDVLSLRRYRDGEYWTGQRQFVEQFLGPLLLASLVGISPNAWYRGNLEGVGIEELARLVPILRRFAPNVFLHVTLPAWLQRRAQTRRGHSEIHGLPQLPKSTLVGLLRRLHRWIGKLTPHRGRRSDWEDYPQCDGYGEKDIRAKESFVARFMQATKPELLLDLGCHTGTYSELALASGARAVIGIDADAAAADAAFATAQARNLNMTVLQMDLANPSPSQGWNGQERQGIRARINANAVLALALVHHLAIGRNVPLADVVDWIISFAPQGIIEFVDPTDQQVRRMLRFRGPAPSSYTRESFLAAVTACARIEDTQFIANGTRLLVWYSRAG